MTGRAVRVAVIDSGVNPSHPHIGRVVGGVAIGDGAEEDSYLDLLGHGTAVMAAIQEKAPNAEYFAVRVFQSELRTRVDQLVRALKWCIEQRIDVINLSLGNGKPGARRSVRSVDPPRRNSRVGTRYRWSAGLSRKPARRDRSSRGLGNARECFACRNGNAFCASGYPRPIPGVPRTVI